MALVLLLYHANRCREMISHKNSTGVENTYLHFFSPKAERKQGITLLP